MVPLENVGEIATVAPEARILKELKLASVEAAVGGNCTFNTALSTPFILSGTQKTDVESTTVKLVLPLKQAFPELLSVVNPTSGINTTFASYEMPPAKVVGLPPDHVTVAVYWEFADKGKALRAVAPATGAVNPLTVVSEIALSDCEATVEAKSTYNVTSTPDPKYIQDTCALARVKVRQSLLEGLSAVIPVTGVNVTVAE